MVTTPQFFVPDALEQQQQQEQRHQRASFTSRISGLFTRTAQHTATRTTSSHQHTPRDTTTFEVPLFLSPTRYEPAGNDNQYAASISAPAPAARSITSPRALFGAIIPNAHTAHPRSPPSPSQYSDHDDEQMRNPHQGWYRTHQHNHNTDPNQEHGQYEDPDPEQDHVEEDSSICGTEAQQASGPSSNIATSELSTINTSDTGSSSSGQNTNTAPRKKKRKHPATHRKRVRKTSTRRCAQTLRQFTLAFGITLLLAIVTYLVLATTGIASGTLFHILCVLLILFLFGVFLHSGLRLFFLRRKIRQRRFLNRRQHNNHNHSQSRRAQWITSSSHPNEPDLEANNDITVIDDNPPEKPIQIIFKEDESHIPHVEPSDITTTTIKFPPPTYGNVRGSKRIDPKLIHWHKVPPSPLTPTYAEAMSEVSQVVGYRPPSYVESDSGATQIINRQRQDVEDALCGIQQQRERQEQGEQMRHPLERGGPGYHQYANHAPGGFL